MKCRWVLPASVIVAVVVFCPAALAEQASVLLEKAVYTEETVGDVDAAIGIYEQVIEAEDATRALLQQAHHRLALCYLKKGMRPEAAVQLRRLIAYPGESDLKAEALKLLGEMTTPDPAALMPPDTFVYLEFGSPGRQFEIALNMLEDTPLEDPIAAMNQGMPAGAQPRAMLGALLNPSMIEEFKKVGGMAVGVHGLKMTVNSVEPDIVAVAYLGESDALRGIAQMAVAGVGRPMADVEGMHVVAFPGPQQTGLAYDDNVMIFATSLDRLQWCVKQYKGVAAEPTLASRNATFSRVDAEKRRESAMTLWVDARHAALVLQEGAGAVPELARAVAVANMVVSQGVDAGTLRFVLDETSPFTEVSVDLARGQTDHVYQVVRTAPLQHSLFRAVPPDAVALSASAFNPGQFQGASSAGLDLSFAHDLSQSVLFILPLDQEAVTPTGVPGAIFKRIGLAMSVRQGVDPRSLLDRIALVPAAITGMAGGPVLPVRHEGDIAIVPLPEGGPIRELRLAAAGDYVVVAASPEVLDASLKALRDGPSALDEGPLYEPLARLEADTSKLILGNAGRLLAGGMGMAKGMGNVDPQLDSLMADLAGVLQGTSLQICTHETNDNITVRLGVLDLPPAAEALPVLMALSQYAQAMGPGMAAVPQQVTIEAAPGPIAVDGDPGDWQGVPTTAWSDQRGDLPPLQLCWTAAGIYGLVTAVDASIEVNGEEPWMNDSLQIFIEADAARRDAHSELSRSILLWPDPGRGPGVAEMQVEFHEGGTTTQSAGVDPVTGVQAAWKRTATGYTMEFLVPARVLAPAALQPGSQIGLAVMLRDGSSSPVGWLAAGVGDDAWARPDKWARILLTGPPVPVDVGYSETPIIVDGKTADWAGVPPLPTPEGYPFQLSWRDEGIYGLVTSHDDNIQINPTQHWLADGMQMFIEKDFARSHDHTANSVDIALWPNTTAGPGPCGLSVYSHALGQNLWPAIQTAWAPTADGYVMEFHLPADFLKPAVMTPGTLIGFTALLRTTGVEATATAPQDLGPDSYLHPDEWGAIRLVAQVN
jgi:hypothetical protein